MSLKINKQTALKLYPEAPGWFREVLNEKFGSGLFRKMEYTDIKTFDDACKVLGTTEEEFNEKFAKLGLELDTLSYEKLKIIVGAINKLNNSWQPDWDNSSQNKYYPLFNLSSGSGFSDYDYASDSSYSDVGSRLCFGRCEECNYAANQFKSIYRDFLTIK